jgi:hypothetical protein
MKLTLSLGTTSTWIQFSAPSALWSQCIRWRDVTNFEVAFANTLFELELSSDLDKMPTRVVLPAPFVQLEVQEYVLIKVLQDG